MIKRPAMLAFGRAADRAAGPGSFLEIRQAMETVISKGLVLVVRGVDCTVNGMSDVFNANEQTDDF